LISTTPTKKRKTNVSRSIGSQTTRDQEESTARSTRFSDVAVGAWVDVNLTRAEERQGEKKIRAGLN